MSRDSAKAHYTKQPGDPDEGFITASDAQAAIDDIYDDMSAPAVIADGSVTSGKIAADAVGSAQIATGAVGSGELATDAVTSDKIADGAVSNAHVASDAAIAASKVAGTAVTQADTGTVTNGMLAGSIAKTKVAGTAITAADTGTVTGTMIAAGAVDNGNLAANAVNEAKIASGAVTTVKIADDAVTSDKIADNAVTAAQIAANAVGASELADNAVDTAAIAADAVTADKIANDTITAAELAANSVGTSELANDSVTAAKILDGTITANEIQNASITGVKLVNDTITATQIAANAVGAPELADDSVDTAAIQSKAVTAAKIADDTITATQIAANAVGSSELAANGVNTAAIQDGAVTAAKLAVQPGNLLTENQAGGDSGWSSDGTFSAGTAGDGVFTLTTAYTYLSTSTRFAVTAEQTYTARAELAPVGGGSYVTIDFKNASSGGSTVGSFSGNTIPAAGSGLSQVVAVAPAGATYADVTVVPTGSATSLTVTKPGAWRGTGGQWALPGTPILGLTDAPIGNLLTLNAASIEMDTSGWTVDGGVTLSKQASPTYRGSASLLATCTGTGAGQFSAAAPRIPVTAGEVVTFQAQAHAGVGTRQVQALLLFYTAASGGTLVGGDSVKGPLVTTAGSWQTAALTTVVPSGATHAVPSIGLAAGGATDAVYFDALSFHRGAAGTFALPGTPVVGGSHIATNGAVHLSGTGTPEGVVTAAPGSTWLQTDSTTDVKGWIRWIKATGTGNTGWIAGPDADTGWRDISATLENSWAGTLYIRRVGQLVHVHGSLTGTSATSHLALSSNPLPSGFRPKDPVQRAVSRSASLADNIHVEIAISGAMAMWSGNGKGAGQIVSETFLAASTTWPSSLPGSAA